MKKSDGAMKKRVLSVMVGLVMGTVISASVQADVSTEVEPYPSQVGPAAGSRDFSIRELLDQVTVYLNGFRSMHAHFKQEDPDGTIRFGELYIQKPGLMRIAYRGLKGLLIVSDGSWLSYDDKALDQVSYVPLHTTPASLILKDKFDFKDTLVEKVEFMPEHNIHITVRNKEEPDAGALTLIFKQYPMVLAGWQVVDQSTQMTVVELSRVEVGGKAPEGSFELSGPGA